MFAVTRVCLFLFLVLGLNSPLAPALTFNLTYDSSTTNAPAAFFSAFQYAINFYQTNYTDPITINLQVGWGQINGQSLSPGNLGQSSTFQRSYTFSQIKSAFSTDAKSASDATALAHLPVTDPTGGAPWVMSTAQAKAFGLLAGNATGLDGYIGFNTNAAFTFDPNNRAISGKYDFIGLASHAITEIMGRYGLGQNGASSGRYSPIDLFRYLSAGTLDLVPTNGAYFSIDGGATVINTFNGTGGGDLSDWAGATVDPYNHNITIGRKLVESPGDIIEMDVLGYDLAVGQPQLAIALTPSNTVLLSWTSVSTIFKIQTNSSIASSNWFTGNYVIGTTNGTNHSATLAPPKNDTFFRLVK